LATTMTNKVGVFRVGSELDEAVRQLADIGAEFNQLQAAPPAGPFDYRFIAWWELGWLIDVALLVARAAARRTESRGAHFRSDYPARDDGRWRVHTFATKTAQGPQFEDGEVQKGAIAPEARVY